jgi:hypothetical protein
MAPRVFDLPGGSAEWVEPRRGRGRGRDRGAAGAWPPRRVAGAWPWRDEPRRGRCLPDSAFGPARSSWRPAGSVPTENRVSEPRYRSPWRPPGAGRPPAPRFRCLPDSGTPPGRLGQIAAPRLDASTRQRRPARTPRPDSGAPPGRLGPTAAHRPDASARQRRTARTPRPDSGAPPGSGAIGALGPPIGGDLGRPPLPRRGHRIQPCPWNGAPGPRRHRRSAASGPEDPRLPGTEVTWSSLSGRARTWRIFHASWAVAQLLALALIWRSAIRRRRSARLWASVAFLLAEGAALIIGRGNCPMGPRQAEWGDPVPFFELVLPKRAAKAAIPILAAVSVAGIAALVLRRPGLAMRADRRSAGPVGGVDRETHEPDLLEARVDGRTRGPPSGAAVARWLHVRS